MRNIPFLYIVSLLSILFFCMPVMNLHAEEADTSGMEFIEEFVQAEEALDQARSESKNLLETKPQVLTLRENEEKLLQEAAKKREELAHKIDEKRYIEDKKKMTINDVISRLKKAPFGLYWNATLEEMKTMDFLFSPTVREDYSGVYHLTNPKQKHALFSYVLSIFGTQNHLWCIYAQSKPSEDTADAAGVLKLYHQYYEALKAKYGNDQEFFTPYTYIEEQTIGEGDEKKVIQIKHENPLGGENFLEELKTNKAALYATFESADLGITLTVNVDENNKSFITIDYKNLKVMQKEKNTNLENLMEDL